MPGSFWPAHSPMCRVFRGIFGACCLGLTLAAGSGFTNGFAQVCCRVRITCLTAFFLPSVLPLGLLAFWMIRVRSKNWHPSGVERKSGNII